MSRPSSKSKKPHGTAGKDEVDNGAAKWAHQMAEDPSDGSESSVSNSDEASIASDGEGYETGDSAGMDIEEGSELGVEHDGSSSANSDSEGEGAMSVDASDAEEENLKIEAESQKLLRAAVTEELDKISLMPSSGSVEFADAQAESSLLKSHLKTLKNVIQAFEPIQVTWNGVAASSAQSSTPSKKAKSKATSSAPAFNALDFLSTYFAQLGGEKLAKSIQKEFALSAELDTSAGTPSEETSIFNWSTPTEFNVVGSYLHGTTMRSPQTLRTSSSPSSPLYSVDLAFALPEAMWKHKDIKGHRYDTKRLLYLAVLMERLSSLEAPFSAVEWQIDHIGDVSHPNISVIVALDMAGESSSNVKKRRRDSKTRFVRIVLRPCVSADTFKLSQLLPWKPQKLFFGHLPVDNLTAVYRCLSTASQNLIPNSPLATQKASFKFAAMHNHRVAVDALTKQSNLELSGFFQGFPASRHAVVLAVRWMQSRHLTHVFNTHIISCLFAYLASIKVFKQGQDALDIFKAFVSWLATPKRNKMAAFDKLLTETHGVSTSATRDIHVSPPTLAMPKTKSGSEFKTAYASCSDEILKSQFSLAFDAVLVDSTGYFNVLARVSAAAWSQLSYEALLSSRLLEHPDQYSFSTLFKTTISQSDKALRLTAQPPKHSDYDAWLSATCSITSTPTVRLPTSTTIYAKAAPTTTSKKLTSTAMLGGRKAGTAHITISTVSNEAVEQVVDEAKTAEANEWLEKIAKTAVVLNLADALELSALVSESLLYQSLLPRVEYASFFPGLLSETEDRMITWPSSEQLPNQFVLRMGLKVQATQWLKLLEYGPQAQNEELVEDFVRVWGKGTAGLRKFKDGLILYCVSWGTSIALSTADNVDNLAANANKHRIVQRLSYHLLNRHLSNLSTGPATNAPASGSPADEETWAVSMFGDVALRELLSATERKNPDLLGPTWKTVPAPMSSTDLHEHVNFVWTQLQKALRALKGLSMPIKTLNLRGEIARNSSLAVPVYNPLADPEIPFAQRQYAIRASSSASQLCPSAVPCIIQFESSGAWPEDLDAISHVKTALLLDLSKHLSEQHASTIASRVGSGAIYIYFKGYTFKFVVFHPRELVIRNMLYRQVVIAQRTDEQQKQLRERVEKLEKMKQIAEGGSIVPLASSISKSSKQGASSSGVGASNGASISGSSTSTVISPEMLSRQRVPLVGPVNTKVEPLQSVADDFSRFGVSPRVSILLHSLQLAYPAFGPTCVLVKKWMAAHLLPLAEFADGLLVDLLVSRVFHSTPYLAAPWTAPPSHAYAGFLRVMFLLAHLSWESGPVVVPLHEDHEGGQLSSMSMLTTTNNSPLGWSLDKVERLQRKWKNIDAAARAVLTVYFNDGSSTYGREETDEPNEEETGPTKTNLPGVATLSYGTPNSRHSTDWCVDAFAARAILDRMRRLASRATQTLSARIGSDEAVSFVFEPSLLDFDIVIELKRNALTRHLSLNKEKKSKKSEHKYLEPPTDLVNHAESMQASLGSASIPPLMPDFNPVDLFLEKLRERLTNRSLIFHDANGGPLIGVVLKPSVFVPTSNITNANSIHALPLSDVRNPDPSPCTPKHCFLPPKDLRNTMSHAPLFLLSQPPLHTEMSLTLLFYPEQGTSRRNHPKHCPNHGRDLDDRRWPRFSGPSRRRTTQAPALSQTHFGTSKNVHMAGTSR